MLRTAASRSTAYVRVGLPPPAPADQTTASCPLIRSASPSTSSSSMSASTGRAPVAATSDSWSELRTTAVTLSPRATSNGARRSATLPCPPKTITLDIHLLVPHRTCADRPAPRGCDATSRATLTDAGHVAAVGTVVTYVRAHHSHR